MLSRQFGVTACELSVRMTWREFMDHVSDYAREPWGERRADLRNAMLMSLVAAGLGQKCRPLDFMPFEKRERQTDQEMYQRLRRFTAQFGK